MRVHMAVHKIILAIALTAWSPSMVCATNPTDTALVYEANRNYWLKGVSPLLKAMDYRGLVSWSRRWIQDIPDDPSAWDTLGGAYEGLRLYPEALAAYREALRLNPNDAYILANIGEIHRDMGRFGEAIAVSREALRFASADKSNLAEPKALYTITIAYAELGNRGAAFETLDKLRHVSPKGQTWLISGL